MRKGHNVKQIRQYISPSLRPSPPSLHHFFPRPGHDSVPATAEAAVRDAISGLADGCVSLAGARESAVLVGGPLSGQHRPRAGGDGCQYHQTSPHQGLRHLLCVCVCVICVVKAKQSKPTHSGTRFNMANCVNISNEKQNLSKRTPLYKEHLFCPILLHVISKYLKRILSVSLIWRQRGKPMITFAVCCGFLSIFLSPLWPP